MSSRFCAVSSEPALQTGGSDLILPCQYYDISGGHSLTGEQRLMLALLTDAINVYQKGVLSRRTNARRLYVDAERWILADDSSCGWLSFGTVCEALGIHAGLLRKRVIHWKHAINRQCENRPKSSRTHLQTNPRADRVGHPRPSPEPAARAM
ncbi:MAG: hypothetical protein HY269_01165 [Deltaproteobacteria bacterium]|nr:hypothetical protein [Deltaproteobacteria bacterium]